MKIKINGIDRSVRAGRIFIGNQLRNIISIQIMDNGVLKRVASFVEPLTASINPQSVTGIGSNVFVTPLVTVTPTGGRAPFSYQWSILQFSGSVSPFIRTPNSASTQFQSTVENQTATFQCIVTDSIGNTDTVIVNALFLRFNQQDIR